MRTIALLTISNIFMTFAWYGHLKYREVPLYKVIVLSWLIAFFEYCFQVPANRIGSYEFSAAQLKRRPSRATGRPTSAAARRLRVCRNSAASASSAASISAC